MHQINQLHGDIQRIQSTGMDPFRLEEILDDKEDTFNRERNEKYQLLVDQLEKALKDIRQENAVQLQWRDQEIDSLKKELQQTHTVLEKYKEIAENFTKQLDEKTTRESKSTFRTERNNNSYPPTLPPRIDAQRTEGSEYVKCKVTLFRSSEIETRIFGTSQQSDKEVSVL